MSKFCLQKVSAGSVDRAAACMARSCLDVRAVGVRLGVLRVVGPAVMDKIANVRRGRRF